MCHTLAAANAVGKVGPNLDTLKPADLAGAAHDQQRLPAEPPTSGSAQQCLGQGVMPADMVTGKDAQDVAQFVSKVAGNE